VKERTFTILRQLPLWEMESQWTPETSESNCRGQTSMSCGVPFIIGKLLERRCLKWACIAHLKALDESYNFASDRTSIGGLLAKLWGSKVAKVPARGISGLSLRSLGKKSHLDVASMESCRVYYKGEGGGFPQVWVVVSLVCLCCPWLVLAPRVL